MQSDFTSGDLINDQIIGLYCMKDILVENERLKDEIY